MNKIFDDPNFPFDLSKMRDLTPEENENIKRYIDSISTPIGNVWDLINEEESSED